MYELASVYIIILSINMETNFKMKNKAMILLSLLALVLVLAGCGKADKSENEKTKISVVTTIFPEYDWVREIAGDEKENMEITMLLDNAVDLHSFQPTVDDIIKISNCDLFIYVGGESDGWVESALENAGKSGMRVINLLEVLGEDAKKEEAVEGMEGEDHDHEEDESEHEEEEYDEHVWLSLRNAEKFVRVIADALAEIDPEHKESYSVNVENYIEKLSALDGEYEKVVSGAERKTVLFGDRFPFRYLTDDYGLEYYAAFMGCSAETEASFETVSFLARKVDELSLPYVMTIDGTKHRIAETIIGNTEKKNQKVLSMNSMQSTTMKDVENGETYLSIMEKNLSVLREALN